MQDANNGCFGKACLHRRSVKWLSAKYGCGRLSGAFGIMTWLVKDKQGNRFAEREGVDFQLRKAER